MVESEFTCQDHYLSYWVFLALCQPHLTPPSHPIITKAKIECHPDFINMRVVELLVIKNTIFPTKYRQSPVLWHLSSDNGNWIFGIDMRRSPVIVTLSGTEPPLIAVDCLYQSNPLPFSSSLDRLISSSASTLLGPLSILRLANEELEKFTSGDRN